MLSYRLGLGDDLDIKVKDIVIVIRQKNTCFLGRLSSSRIGWSLAKKEVSAWLKPPPEASVVDQEKCICGWSHYERTPDGVAWIERLWIERHWRVPKPCQESLAVRGLAGIEWAVPRESVEYL